MEKLAKLDRRYKCYKVLKWVLGIVSIAVAVIPAICVAVTVAPSIPRVPISVGITGAAAFVLGVGLIFIIRGLEKRYAHKLPWATSALLWTWVLYCLIFSLGKVIVQIEQVSLALALGVSAAFVLSLGSELCRVLAAATKDEYERLK